MARPSSSAQMRSAGAGRAGRSRAERRPRSVARGRRAGRVGPPWRRRAARDEQQQHQHAHHRHAEAHREHRVVPVGRGPQDHERHERAEQRARGVHGPVHAERPAAGLGCGRQGDQRVARRGAQALAGTVDRQHRADQRQGVHHAAAAACTAPRGRSRPRRPPCGAPPPRSARWPPTSRTSALKPL